MDFQEVYFAERISPNAVECCLHLYVSVYTSRAVGVSTRCVCFQFGDQLSCLMKIRTVAYKLAAFQVISCNLPEKDTITI